MEYLNIIVDDENHYFAAGLRHSIIEYARAHSKAIRVMTPETEVQPDVVIASSRRRDRRWRRNYYCAAAVPVVTIKEQQTAAGNKLPRVLYRTDSPEKLFELLTETLSNSQDTGLFERQALTRREQQILKYLRFGFDQSQTARLLGISVKTVHSHKRSVMKKLMLSRNHEFIYWLLSHEGEYS